MSDEQVMAVYFRMIEEKPKSPELPSSLEPPEIKETDDDAPSLF